MSNSRGAIYCLTGDDGAQLRVRGDTWESSLELAFFYGWRPLGTEAPQTEAWRNPTAAGQRAWDRKNYFSRESQHVDAADARALADAVYLALQAVPDSSRAVGTRAPRKAAPLPSRASANADGLSHSRRKLILEVARFAHRGGFTIGD